MIRYFFQAGLFAVAVAACTSCGGRASQAERDKTAVSTAVETKSMIELKDYGAEPAVLDIEAYTLGNENFRTVLWTGTNLQVTLMTIPVGGEVGLELHPDIDQFLRIEEGEAKVMMGDSKEDLNYVRTAKADHAVFVPAGKWHNLVNIGDKPLKLYSIYAPVEHPYGTVHKTYDDAMAAEHRH